MELLPILPLAEGEGFEPPEVLPSMVFKTTAIGRSAIPPHDSGDDTAKAESLSTASLPQRPESALLRSFKEGGPESAAKTLFARYDK